MVSIEPKRRLRVHFYVTSPSWGEIESWDPDVDPWRFGNSTESHAILELFVRLRRRGHAVTLGPKVPTGATGVVVLMGRLQESPGRVPAFAVRSLRVPVLVVRSGESMRPAFPLLLPTLVVVPVEKLRSRRNRVMYPLPQRALLPRAVDRRGTIGVAAYKGYKSGVPLVLVSADTLATAKENGVEIRIDIPSKLNSSDHNWHNFEDIDLVFCMRRDLRGDANETKPATKLINAWAAGAIPVIDPQQSYLDIARPGVDAIVARTDSDLCAALRVARNPDQIAILESGVEVARTRFSAEKILNQWEELLVELEESNQPRTRLLLRIIALPLLSLLALGCSFRIRLTSSARY